MLQQSLPQSTNNPSSITLNWKEWKDRPLNMDSWGQPVVLNGKLYIRGGKWSAISEEKVLEYIPDSDQWTELPHTPVYAFTIATLRGQLLVVGGEDKSTRKKSNTILTFNNDSKLWVETYHAMPTAFSSPAVVGYQDHLIVAGGLSSTHDRIPYVNILDTASNKWKTAQPLPSTDYYCSVLIEDMLYLAGRDSQTVLRAHVPTLMSGAKSGVWETLPNTPYYRSSPVTIGNTLLTVGGKDKPSWAGSPTSSIQMYNPTTNQWTRVGDLPEQIGNPHCVIMNSELFVF